MEGGIRLAYNACIQNKNPLVRHSLYFSGLLFAVEEYQFFFVNSTFGERVSQILSKSDAGGEI